MLRILADDHDLALALDDLALLADRLDRRPHFHVGLLLCRRAMLGIAMLT